MDMEKRSLFCQFVGVQLSRPPVQKNPSVHAHESTRDLADFCQILYCGGVPKLNGTFQH
jgi:hypothetical protein